MFARKMFRARFVSLAILVLVFATAAYGFAAANTVPGGNVGDGSNGISGYSVGNVNYGLNNSNPSNIDSVSFDLTGSTKPDTVKVKLVSTGSSWYSCTFGTTVGTTHSYSCTTTSPQATSASADELRIVAAD